MLKIWGRANSINVQKVLWCCGELGLQYDRIDAGNEFGVTKTSEYRALNPNALVPAIEDGDFQLWESNVIVRYLAQKCQHSCPCPADVTTRFDSERWMEPRRWFIGGMRWIFITPTCPTSTDGIDL